MLFITSPGLNYFKTGGLFLLTTFLLFLKHSRLLLTSGPLHPTLIFFLQLFPWFHFQQSLYHLLELSCRLFGLLVYGLALPLKQKLWVQRIFLGHSLLHPMSLRRVPDTGWFSINICWVKDEKQNIENSFSSKVGSAGACDRGKRRRGFYYKSSLQDISPSHRFWGLLKASHPLMFQSLQRTGNHGSNIL